MPIFKTKTFNKWQEKESIKDSELMLAIEEMGNGLVDAAIKEGTLIEVTYG